MKNREKTGSEFYGLPTKRKQNDYRNLVTLTR